MSSKPPFFRQERSDTCMLACLRMLLAHLGTAVTEHELRRHVALDEGASIRISWPGWLANSECERNHSSSISMHCPRWLPVRSFPLFCVTACPSIMNLLSMR